VKKFAAAFAICLTAIVLLHGGMYLIGGRHVGEDTYLRVGLPLTFWREGPGYSRFRPVALCADIVFALWISYRVGRWWEQRGTPDYVAGTKT